MKFEDNVIVNTVDKLIRGEDYREEVLNHINVVFLDQCIDFFKLIVEKKMSGETITQDWYKQNFILDTSLSKEDVAYNAGINIKSISNIHGTTSKKVVIDVAKDNYDYLSTMINELGENEDQIDIEISLKYNSVSVSLNLTESLIVINALATKKIALRGGAWSAIGKSVEKPLMLKLCELVEVDPNFIDASVFVKDVNKEVDREIDFKLYNGERKEYKIEVKLMGKGNPESADAIIARDTDIFIADTLSEQNIAQITSLGVEYLVLKDNLDVVKDFTKIIDKLEIPRIL